MAVESAESDRDEAFVQGMCERVDINIDNMRPSEMMFREDDFIDSEISGDEEWTGGNDVLSPPTRYAW